MYCPDCDMDFVEGITVCTDCGRPLVDKAKWEEEKAAAEALSKSDSFFDENEEAVHPTLDDEETKKHIEEIRKAMLDTDPVYVNQKDKYENKKSSAYSFLFVGILMSVFSVLCFTGKIMLGPIIKYMSAVFAVLSFIYAYITNKKAEKNKHLIKEEADTRMTLTEEFIKNHSKEDIDEAVSASQGGCSLSKEEAVLAKLAYIQDLLQTENNLSNSFSSEIAEELYDKIYES